jgi:two-component system, NarL family, nitrate/nitrite response regulator NarL
MTRVLITSPIRLYREGLAQLIANQPGLNVVGAQRALPLTQSEVNGLRAHVIVLDIATPGSIDGARRLRLLDCPPAIVTLGVTDTDDEVMACAEAGAVGYVTREGSVDELVVALCAAARGELICSPRIAGCLARRVATLSAGREPQCEPCRLSRREREIALLLGDDLSNKEIAVRLTIEVSTVKNHVHSILNKLQVQRRSDAARLVR